MTQEDKAKAYDKLINDIKRIMFNHEGGKLYNLLEQKDEQELPNSAYTSNKSITEFADEYSHMIWDKLMDKFNKIENYSIGCNDVSDIVLNAIINTYNWLKKQDKEKPIDKIKLKPEGKSTLDAINEEKVNNANTIKIPYKIEPKFKTGDWIVDNQNHLVCQIIGYENNLYRIRNHNTIYHQLIKVIDKTCHLWTIKDANPGDVVVTKYGNIFIFKEIKGYSVYGYCGLYFEKLNVNSSIVNNIPLNCTPATKEQCDLLIKALNDEGYTFDFDKKEVKFIKSKFHKGDYIVSERGSFSIIGNVGDVRYEVESLDHKKVFPDIGYIDKRYHLYTIEDSKFGDVLSTKNNIFIFGHDNKALVGIPKTCWNIKGYSELKFGFSFNIKDVHPATSDECDKLKEVMINYLSKYGK